MNTEQPSDEIYVAELAERVRGETKPLCPQFRTYALDGLYPVRGHCILARCPGWFMIPSIEEYGRYCTSRGFVHCPWFRGTGNAVGPIADQSG